MIVKKKDKKIVSYNFNCSIDFVNLVLLIKCKVFGKKKYFHWQPSEETTVYYLAVMIEI